MPGLNWEAFKSLPGSKDKNFDNLCRGLMRLHYGSFGKFKALSNQPGVEFHVNLTKSCSLGDPPRWFGWQCKFHERTVRGDLKSSSKKDIETSIQTTKNHLPRLTDWILWTPYTLSKKDQDWFYSLQYELELNLWCEEELDNHLNGNALLLKESYFGELILTPEELKLRHEETLQPIKGKWLEPVHQLTKAERTIRKILGEQSSWDQMTIIGKRLIKYVETISKNKEKKPPQLKTSITAFIEACTTFSDILLNFHEIITQGDLDIIKQKFEENKNLINSDVYFTPSKLRTKNLSIALDATNALHDMRIAQTLLDEVEDILETGIVALIADAGGGKTQIAAELTKTKNERPSGILLYGKDLHKGQTLDDLAQRYKIYGKPVTSMESLLAALDAAGKRSGCRLPILIDGLNEAEDPRDWKGELAKIAVVVKRYPNVLIVCTLRTGEHRRNRYMPSTLLTSNTKESFAVLALPENIKIIESEGFGGDVTDAIKKYFTFFKINSNDAEIPTDFLNHPLTLRIFCQVTNPDRKSEITINYFPSSLTLLFEKYIANSCEKISQMTNLNYTYCISDVEMAIYKLGIALWEEKKRETDEKKYRETISDTTRPWTSSIVNLLVQEGIIFRNTDNEPGEYLITPAYDALGGFIIANSLITKHKHDTNFEWFKNTETIELFIGDNTHPLAFDIFKSLIALVPCRMYGNHLWQVAPDQFKNTALKFTMLLDAKYLKSNTISEISDLFNKNNEEKIDMFPRLQETRAIPDHPLNSLFFDSCLCSMSVLERDLSWTEWIRGTHLERLNEVLSIEIKWKDNIKNRSIPDQLRLKWLKWFLTSTNHELRDLTTRALYWFGRGDPEVLFTETIDSLKINDPYIPERMLAASYGVAMALHVDFDNSTFLEAILPKYAHQLYELMFSEKAQFQTTHLLMREYAYRTIELFIYHNSSSLSNEEFAKIEPPFSTDGIREWGEVKSSKEELSGHDSPFRMDFENYTLGGLVHNRDNYQFNHKEYKKVRAQILWRIEELGWSVEKFNEIDSSIENSQFTKRIGSEANKIDRYGKKYSWIAYYEMSGLLQDQGKLDIRRKIDIDPSFPEPITKGEIIKTNFLGNSKITLKEWIDKGALPDIEPYLKIDQLQSQDGTWIALDGFVSQENEDISRKLFCFIRSIVVPSENIESFETYLSNQDLGGRWLPEKPELYYVYSGEIPWCKNFPNNAFSEFDFITKEEIIKVPAIKQELYLDGNKLNVSQSDLILLRLGIKEKELFENITEEELKRIEIRDTPIEVDEVKRKYKKFNALIPVCDYSIGNRKINPI